MSKNVIKFLAGAVAASALSASALAGPVASDYVNGGTLRQVNWGPVYAITTITADWVGGDLRGAATAVGNNMSVTHEGSTWLYLTQVQLADTGAELKAHVGNVTGDVDLSSTAICNNISTKTTKAQYSHVGSDQRCETEDPYAIANAVAYNIGGDFTLTATAVANNASIVAESASNDIQMMQVNPAAVNATVNANVYNVAGNVDISATAIGNNISVNHTFGN